MTSEERIRQQKELVETLGRVYDKQGFQPIAGRILGLLMVMDKEQFTFDEIVEELRISKSSASNTLRMLEMQGVIEYITKTGDRKRYFRLKQADRFGMIDEHKAKLIKMNEYMQKALELKADKNSQNSLYLMNMIDMTSFFIAKFDELKKEYTKKN